MSSSSTQRSSTVRDTSTTTSDDSRRPAPLPLPAVKGTMGGIETPKRDIWSPGLRSAPGTPTASAAPSAAPSLAGASVVASTASERTVVPTPHAAAAHAAAAEGVVFRADPRLRTCFEGMPEGGGEVARLFGL